MPELPEVETCCRGLQPHLVTQRIVATQIRERRLRQPIPDNISHQLLDQTICRVERRAKYLLLTLSRGTLIIHLGMSGSLRLSNASTPLKKHDHVILSLSNQQCLRFHDPRRFGVFLWTEQPPNQHSLLKNLGLEPLSTTFNSQYLWEITHTRKTAIKSLIMDQKIIVGVGNIYANEALFAAKIYPAAPANTLSLPQIKMLVQKIKTVLKAAIKQGGTTLRDFVDSQGQPGYFKQRLYVYDRAGKNCINCQTVLIELKIGQRCTVYCPNCQL